MQTRKAVSAFSNVFFGGKLVLSCLRLILFQGCSYYWTENYLGSDFPKNQEANFIDAVQTFSRDLSHNVLIITFEAKYQHGINNPLANSGSRSWNYCHHSPFL